MSERTDSNPAEAPGYDDADWEDPAGVDAVPKSELPDEIVDNVPDWVDDPYLDRVRDRDRFDEVHALFMDEEPEIDDVTDHFASDDVVVVPLFVADGYHTQEDIPADMGIADDAGGYAVPTRLDGHDIWYAGAIGTEALMADVILDRAADAGAAIDRDARPGRTPTAAADGD